MLTVTEFVLCTASLLLNSRSYTTLVFQICLPKGSQADFEVLLFTLTIDIVFVHLLNSAELVFLNVYGAQESIQRNEFRQRAGTIILFLLGS